MRSRTVRQKQNGRVAHERAGDRLKDVEVCDKFKLKLENRFTCLSDGNDDDDEEQIWNKFKAAVTDTSTEVVGFCKGKRKAWLSDKTWQQIEQRLNVKCKINSETDFEKLKLLKIQYNVLNKSVKCSARSDKRKWYEDLAIEAEVAASKNDFKTVHRIVKKLTGAKQVSKSNVKDKNGITLTDVNSKLQRWASHFSDVLNREDPVSTISDKVIQDICFDVEGKHLTSYDLNEITETEIKSTITKLKSGKAKGIDDIHAEILKAGGDVVVSELHKLFNMIWKKENVPSDWRKGIITCLPKKGDLSDCNNWRGITLLSVPSKVFTRIIFDRISVVVDTILREEQAGFRKGHSCVDQIHILRLLIDRCESLKSTLNLAFVDFEKAFDSVHRHTLWRIIEAYGIPSKYISIMRNIYDGTQCCVKTADGTTDWFEIKTGVRQGCVLSTLLFLIVIDFVMRRTSQTNKGIAVNGRAQLLSDLDFADDIVLLSNDQDGLQQLMNSVFETGQYLGLKVNVKKTNVLSIGNNDEVEVSVAGKKLEQVNSYSYLGTVIDSTGNINAEINSRIGKASRAFSAMYNIWHSKHINTKTKLSLYNSNVVSVLLYGSECWPLTVTNSKKIDGFDSKCLRRIMDIKWQDKVTNIALRDSTGQTELTNKIRKRRLQWFGHVTRMNNNSLPRAVMLKDEFPVKRNKGRPKETWHQTLKKDFKLLQMTEDEAICATADRNNWRCLVARCANGVIGKT